MRTGPGLLRRPLGDNRHKYSRRPLGDKLVMRHIKRPCMTGEHEAHIEQEIVLLTPLGQVIARWDR